MPFHAIGDLGQVFLRVLQEVGCGAMGLESRIILVLLVDEEPPRLSAMPVHLVGDAPGFLARFFGEFRKQLGRVCFAACFCHPGNCQNDHSPDSVAYFFPCARDLLLAIDCRSARNSSTKIVSSRPGPVETIPIRAPVSAAMNSRYSRAAVGSFLYSVMPCV